MNELALFLLDLVYNSIASQARLIKILIEISHEMDVIRMVVVDDGKGMDLVTQTEALSPFYTTRTTRKIGLGLPLIKQSCEMCNGKFSLESQLGFGTTITMQWELSHIDTMPIGDLGMTMMTLINADLKIDYILQVVKDGNTFGFDTKELKVQLEEEDLGDPAVLIYLRDYINEQLMQ
jgi:hypothetical protein